MERGSTNRARRKRDDREEDPQVEKERSLLYRLRVKGRIDEVSVRGLPGVSEPREPYGSSEPLLGSGDGVLRVDWRVLSDLKEPDGGHEITHQRKYCPGRTPRRWVSGTNLFNFPSFRPSRKIQDPQGSLGGVGWGVSTYAPRVSPTNDPKSWDSPFPLPKRGRRDSIPWSV